MACLYVTVLLKSVPCGSSPRLASRARRMVTPSTMPSTSAYKPFQVEFWLLGKQFVVTEAEHAGGRAELGKLIPPRLVLPMKYCNVFCEFCWPSSRTKSAQV